MAKLYFSYAAMNAGKSTVLLQVAHNYTERGMYPYLLNTGKDNQGNEGQVSSRIGIAKKSDMFSKEEDLFLKIKEKHSRQKIDCVLIDEAQWLSAKQVWQLSQVSDELKIPVMCYGLRTDFQGKLFPGSQELLAVADELREIRTICKCGKKATMNIRLDSEGNPVQDGPQNLVGGNETYDTACRKHWKKMVGWKKG